MSLKKIKLDFYLKLFSPFECSKCGECIFSGREHVYVFSIQKQFCWDCWSTLNINDKHRSSRYYSSLWDWIKEIKE